MTKPPYDDPHAGRLGKADSAGISTSTWRTTDVQEMLETINWAVKQYRDRHTERARPYDR